MRKIKVRNDVPKEPAMVIENQLILKEGNWKGVPLTSEEIRKGIKNTDWSDKRNSSIYFGHDPKKTENWVGNYVNRRYLTLKDGVDIEGFYADLEIYDSDLASKLAYGKAKMAVSQGLDYAWGRTGPYDIKYNHLGIVHDPGCRDERLFLNLDNEDIQVEGERYSGEYRCELNLDSEDDKEEIITTESAHGSEIKQNTNTKILNLDNIEKEDKKMTETESANSAPKISEEELKSAVLKVLEDQKFSEAEKAKKVEEEAKLIEQKADEKAAEKLKELESKKEELKEEPKKEDLKPKEDLSDKLNEILATLKSKKEPSLPQTVAKPQADNVNGVPINHNQAEIAQRLVDEIKARK